MATRYGGSDGEVSASGPSTGRPGEATSPSAASGPAGDAKYRALLNALPLWAFIVDADVRILDLNDAAAEAFGRDAAVLQRRGGEVMHCLHATDAPQGCGRGPHCRSCVIRNAVGEALRGRSVSRRTTRVTLVAGAERTEYDLLVSASVMPATDGLRALLILEDVSELFSLRHIIPICSHCKKVRDDQEYWAAVETYFEQRLGVGFSHGLCPACLEEMYPDLDEKRGEVME